MLGLFKRMLSKSEPANATPFAKPASSAAGAKPSASAPAHCRDFPVVPRTVAAPVSFGVQPRSVTPPPATATHVQVALAAIASSLPESISHKVPASPEQFVAIPVDRILPQLAHGMVVMTVGELLECAPDSFAALSGNEELPVTLPLGDIVKQVSSEHFARRSQKRVEIPSEVTSVFASGNSGVSISRPAPAQAGPIARPQPMVTTTSIPKSSPDATPATIAPSKISMSPQALVALGAKTEQSGALRAIPLQQRAGEQKPAPAQGGPTPAALKRSAPTVGVAKIAGDLAVPLGFVCNEWADEVRAQMAGVNVSESQIMVPLELLQPSMQSGKVVFSWQEVASWIRPSLMIPPTQKVGEMAVEFPLKIIAPLFMAHHRAAIQKRVAVDESIPDLFAGGDNGTSARAQITQPSPSSGATKKEFTPLPQRAGSAVPAAAAPMRTASSTPASSGGAKPEVVQQPAKSNEISLEQLIGSAGKRLNAKEIVANAARLPGVVGALLAMSDGLLVISQTPPQVKAETIAAFLPQMFGRMNQYTKELGLGPLHQLTLGVESAQWNVFKGETIYFAVLGKRGEMLQLNLLAQVAAELSSQSK